MLIETKFIRSVLTVTVISVFLSGKEDIHFNISRRLKSINLSFQESQSPFTYKSLIEAIEMCEKLVPDGDIWVSSPIGNRNLRSLNNISSYYQGRDALYYLAMDLELAIKNGFIPWQGSLRRFDTFYLNRLSPEFRSKLKAQKVYFSWRRFFELKREINANSDKYRRNEGLVRLGFEVGVNKLSDLYDTFYLEAQELGWKRLDVTLEKLQKAKKIFETNPVKYRGYEGMRNLATASNIDNPRIIYYARNEFQGYIQDDFNWRENVISRKEWDMLEGRLKDAGLNITVGGMLRKVDEETLIALMEATSNWGDYLLNYCIIDALADSVSTMFGTGARNVSLIDRIVYGEFLEAIDGEMKRILKEINDLIIEAIIEAPRAKIEKITFQAQRDLSIMLEILNNYKEGRLQEITFEEILPEIHHFYLENPEIKAIHLVLHEEETPSHEMGIRWRFWKQEGESLAFRLDKIRGEKTINLEIQSPALESIYEIVREKGKYHFKLNVPDIGSGVFKMLVRIFY